MNYKLHYAPLDLNEQDIHCYELRSLTEVTAFILSQTETDKPAVFLIAVESVVFVSEHISLICKFAEDWIKENTPFAIINNTIQYLEDSSSLELNIFLQEYSSYEEAYKSALEMKEECPLCYK